MELKELQVGLHDLRKLLSTSLKTKFTFSSEVWVWLVDVFVDHPTLGNSAIVDVGGMLYAVPYTDKGVLEPTDTWVQVIRQYTPVETVTATTSESDEDITELGSITILESDDGVKALRLKLLIIEKGFGNKRDNHYYGKPLLEKDAHKLVGVKMYVTNHKANETNVRNEVAVIMSSEYSEAHNGIVAVAGVFDDAFANNVRNRKELGVLESLHCSISASGLVDKKPIEVGGRKGINVAEFKVFRSVDFVTKAGAGGTALAVL